jgi:hypothetical protein
MGRSGIVAKPQLDGRDWPESTLRPRGWAWLEEPN